MKRVVEYEWRLADLMAAAGMHNTTELVPLLAERGIELSRSQTTPVRGPSNSRTASRDGRHRTTTGDDGRPPHRRSPRSHDRRLSHPLSVSPRG